MSDPKTPRGRPVRAESGERVERIEATATASEKAMLRDIGGSVYGGIRVLIDREMIRTKKSPPNPAKTS